MFDSPAKLDPPEVVERRRMLARRHVEWMEHQSRWRWLLDSYEGGNRYRNAIYGWDQLGMPVRNLVRHKREYPDPRESNVSSGSLPGMLGTGTAPGQSGADQASLATNDDYELRRARTPIPGFTHEAIEAHLDEVFAREIDREGPPQLMEWWEDVDGCGTSIKRWMEECIAPLLMLLGQLDLVFAHPAAPEGEEIGTRADQVRHGLDRCVAAYILPENMLWWKLDDAGRYLECLTLEYRESPAGPITCFRHWTATESVLFSDLEYDEKDRTKVVGGGDVIDVTPNPFGRVPIVRVFDRRKPRCRNIGQSRYEGVAERQREYYNRDSELILSDTTQAHPLLQGPEDYVQSDGTVPIGPSWLLPKKKNSQGGAVSYEGFDVIEFPKDGAESIRKNKQDIRDDVDRESRQTKPAGSAGTDGRSVGQSGVSKRLDQKPATKLLAKIAATLRRSEELIAEMALTVLGDGPPDPALLDAVKISYPTTFDLFSMDELATGIQSFQSIMASAGRAPGVEAGLLAAFVRELLPGRDDATYDAYDDEIQAQLDESAKALGMQAEAAMNPESGDTENPPADDEPGSDLTDMGEEPNVRPLKSGVTTP